MKMMKVSICLVFCMVMMCGASAQAKLVAHWSFDTDATDSVGGNNGTLYGDASIVAGGKWGNCLDLDGSGDYVEVPDSDDFIVGEAGYSWSLHYQPDGFGTRYLFCQRDGSGNWIMVHLESGKAYLNIDSAIRYRATSAITPDENGWVHIAWVLDRTGAENVGKIYYNGVEQALDIDDGSTVTGTFDKTVPLQIGRYWNGTSEYYGVDGRMDEVKFFDGPISEQMVIDLVDGNDVSIDMAYAVYPEIGQIDVPIDAQLEWGYVNEPNHLTTPQTLYVKAGDSNFAGGTALGATDRVYDPSSPLEPGTTYYWRVDGTVEGWVSYFTTVPPKPYGEIPADGAVNVDADTTLSFFQAPGDTSTHDVYFGTEPNNLQLVASTTDPNPVIDPDPSASNLSWNTTYYWIVDTAIVTGDPWSFTVGAPNCDPPLPGDATGDCRVRMDDFALMAQDWLECTLTNGVCE